MLFFMHQNLRQDVYDLYNVSKPVLSMAANGGTKWKAKIMPYIHAIMAHGAVIA